MKVLVKNSSKQHYLQISYFLIMKYILLIIPFFISCNNQKKTDATANKELIVKEGTPTSFEEVELNAEQNSILKVLEGNYFALEKNDNTYIYVEDCAYSEADLVITKKLDDVNFWEITVYSNTYDIQKVNQTNNVISIDTNGKTFTFSQEDMVWEVTTAHWDDAIAFTKIENIKEFSHDPCTSIHKIMDGMPEDWYEISEINGKSVIFEPCEEAIGGLTITGETIDFWSGTDPYPIISMTKSYNEVIIFYTNGIQETDSIIMHDMDKAIFRFGKGDETDKRYVPDVIASDFPTVKEDCD